MIEEIDPRLRVVFLGTPEAAAVTLRAVLADGFSVPLAVTRPDRPRRRGGRSSPSPLRIAAEEGGVPVFTPEDINDPESVTRIAAAEHDVLLIVAYGKILKKPLLAASRLFPLNLHFSLLPAYRGAAPVARAIADGCTETGVTVQRVVPKLDAGPILASERVPIDPDENAGQLTDRLSGFGADLTVRTLRAVERGDREETQQDPELATKAPMLRKEEGRVDWARDAEVLRCHVRAMTPWPGATTVFAGEGRKREVPVTLLRAEAVPEEDATPPPGTVTAVDGEGIAVQTGSGRLVVRELKPAGKRALTAREFANGYRASPGDRFQ